MTSTARCFPRSVYLRHDSNEWEQLVNRRAMALETRCISFLSLQRIPNCFLMAIGNDVRKSAQPIFRLLTRASAIWCGSFSWAGMGRSRKITRDAWEYWSIIYLFLIGYCCCCQRLRIPYYGPIKKGNYYYFIYFIYELFYLEIPRIGRLYTIYALGIQAKRFLGFSKYSI